MSVTDALSKDSEVVGKAIGIVMGLPRNIGITLSFTMESVVFRSGSGVTVTFPNALFFNLTTNEIITMIEEKLYDDRVRG